MADPVTSGPPPANPVKAPTPVQILPFLNDVVTQAKPIGIICPSVGLMVYVRQLGQADLDTLNANITAGIAQGLKRRDIVLSSCMCNPNGDQAFSPDFIALMKKASSSEMERIYKAACKMNSIEYVATPVPAKK